MDPRCRDRPRTRWRRRHAAGDGRISPQAAGVSAGARRSSTQRRAPTGARSPRSGAAATPSGAPERQAIALDDYVLTQPPVYTGPTRPVESGRSRDSRRATEAIPVVADFLQAAAEYFQFAPQRPASRSRVQARLCARTRWPPGLTREQAVRVYSFETGGTGNYDVQSGLSASRPGAADLDRDRLQPVAHHQQRRADGRAGPRIHPGADGEGRGSVGRAARGDGPQDRGAEEDGGVLRARCRTPGRTTKSSPTRAQGWARACDGAGHRCRAACCRPTSC